MQKGGVLMRRYELTDEQFALIEPYLPKMKPTGGHPWGDHRRVLNGMFWKLRSGAPWRDIPERYGPWSTIYDRYRTWCQEGRLAYILVALRDTLDAQGQLDWQQWWIDSSTIRASRAAAGARKKGGPATSQLTTHLDAHAVGSAPSCTSCVIEPVSR
jgi:transposase